MTNWLKRIRDYDKLLQRHRNLQTDLEKQKVANIRKKTRIHGLNGEIAGLREENDSLRLDLIRLTFDLFMNTEPERVEGCNKARIDGEDMARTYAEIVSERLKRPMMYYHCTICPPSFITNQRYYHLANQVIKNRTKYRNKVNG